MRLVGLLALLAAGTLSAQEPLHQLCAPCHTTVADDFRTHKHLAAGLDCNACHGDSVEHRNANGAVQPDRVAAPHQQAELCGSCHVEQAESYQESVHGKLVAALERGPNCGTCHDVHRERSARAAERRCQNCHRERPEACSAQPAESKFAVGCANCHEPHLFHTAK
jgi:hypothetical protein